MKLENKLKIVIVILLVIIVYFSLTIIRLENYHYAVQVGFCSGTNLEGRDQCLNKIETRTNPLYHLFYGLIR
ncbi:hypothetical protein E3V08_05120 [Candidatus Atribacteria bacterium MT.SAG.1]|nr:hypothetical protein E3V08_05120 [Candidatus Atribacteria bacterium MT.SAG.1]